ncbi:MAG: hypothetical protein U5J63_13710 [Fodinibius sp.]|nr:hypothetical protein [Fodinibius sp.]
METTIERVIFLQGIELFADVPSEQLAHLAGITRSFTADPDETLFEEGARSQSMFILINGMSQFSERYAAKRTHRIRSHWSLGIF